MTNFIKKIVAGSTKNEQSDCCGVEIKEVESDNQNTAADTCCGTESSSSCC